MRASTALGLTAGIAVCVAMIAGANSPSPATKPAAVSAKSILSTDDMLKAAWMKENDACRGGVDPKAINEACPKRDSLEDQLKDRGWCWAYSDERVFPTDYDWHRCTVATPIGWTPPPDPQSETTTPTVVDDHLVTRELYDRLTINMWREQVTKIMGTPGVNRSSQGGLGMDQLDTVTWGNPDGSQMVLTFRNGLLASKTQFGLP